MSFTTSKNLDLVRQVFSVIERILTDRGALSGLALRNFVNSTKIKEATNTKVEHKEFKKGRISTSIGTGTISGYFDTTAKAFDLGDTSNLLEGDILRFEDLVNKRKGTLEVFIVSIVNATQVTAMKVGWADIALLTTDIAVFQSNANPENSGESERRPLNQPSTQFNYTQILKEGREISGTSFETDNYSEETARVELNGQVLEDFAMALEGLTAGWDRNEFTNPATNKIIRKSGWLAYFTRNLFDSAWAVTWPATLNVVDKASATLTMDFINDGFEYIIKNGGQANAIVCSEKQARAISDLENSKINIALLDAQRGTQVNVLRSPINVNGNQINNIYVDFNMPKDELIMINENKIFLVPLRNRSGIPTYKTLWNGENSSDGVKTDMLGEWSFIFDNAVCNSYTLTNLAV